MVAADAVKAKEREDITRRESRIFLSFSDVGSEYTQKMGARVHTYVHTRILALKLQRTGAGSSQPESLSFSDLQESAILNLGIIQ